MRKKEDILKPRKIRIKVIGIGGGGGSIVSEMAKELKGINFVVADTDEKTFKKVRKRIKRFQFGEKIVFGMGTGMDPELAQKAALAEKDKISKLFEGQDLIVLVGALGGGVGSGAGPIFSELIQKSKAISIGIFTLPFEFEGGKKMKIAKKAALQLQDTLSGIIVVPNEKIFEITDKKMPLKKALGALDDIFSDWMADLLNVILKPSLINIDFADLKTILKGKGHQIFFSQGVSAGPNRVEDILKKVFKNPIFDSGPKQVSRILFNITGGKDLKLKEVELISQTVSELNPRAKIVFGISDSPSYAGKIKMTLLAVSDPDKKEVKPKKKLKREKPKEKPKKKVKRKTAMEVKKEKEEKEKEEWEKGVSFDVPAFLRKQDYE